MRNDPNTYLSVDPEWLKLLERDSRGLIVREKTCSSFGEYLVTKSAWIERIERNRNIYFYKEVKDDSISYA